LGAEDPEAVRFVVANLLPFAAARQIETIVALAAKSDVHLFATARRGNIGLRRLGIVFLLEELP
jgi:hypothetical protein